MYWKELRTIARNVYAGREGWEVGVVGTKVVRQPFSSRKYPEAAKDLKDQLFLTKLVAKAAFDKEEYDALWRRIDPEDYPTLLTGALEGESLKRWLYNTPTNSEYYHSLRFG